MDYVHALLRAEADANVSVGIAHNPTSTVMPNIKSVEAYDLASVYVASAIGIPADMIYKNNKL